MRDTGTDEEKKKKTYQATRHTNHKLENGFRVKEAKIIEPLQYRNAQGSTHIDERIKEEKKNEKKVSMFFLSIFFEWKNMTIDIEMKSSTQLNSGKKRRKKMNLMKSIRWEGMSTDLPTWAS